MEGEESAGGIIYNPRGNIVSTYAWGLGHRKNHEAEWLAILFGLDLVRQNKIIKVVVMGDSKQVIQKMTSGYNQGAVKIRRIYEWVQEIFANIQISFCHILRSNNSKADNLANQGAKLKIGLAIVKGQIKNFNYIP